MLLHYHEVIMETNWSILSTFVIFTLAQLEPKWNYCYFI